MILFLFKVKTENKSCLANILLFASTYKKLLYKITIPLQTTKQIND